MGTLEAKVTEKECRRCHEVKPITEFATHKHSKDGFEYKCRKCIAEEVKIWRLAHPDSVKRTRKSGREKIRGKTRADRGLETIWVEEKECGECHVVKPRGDFYHDARTPDELGWRCKECAGKDNKNWVQKNAESISDKKKKRYYEHREENLKNKKAYRENKRALGIPLFKPKDQSKSYTCKTCGIEKPASDFYNNSSYECKECHSIRNHNNYIKNIDARKKKVSEWRKNNPFKKMAYEDKRRAAKLNSIGGNYTADEFLSLCEEYDYKCLKCGKQFEKLSPDHIFPLGLGGSNSIDNIQPLCFRHNMEKHTKIIDYRLAIAIDDAISMQSKIGSMRIKKSYNNLPKWDLWGSLYGRKTNASTT